MDELIAEIPDSWMDLFVPPGGSRKPGPPPGRTPINGARSRYAERALDAEVALVRAATEGTRNDTLNRAAFSCAQLVAGGELDGHEVERELLSAAMAAGLGEREAMATIRSGVRGGSEHPRQRPRSTAGTGVPTDTEDDSRPLIKISADMAEVVNAAERAIDEDPAIEMYQRGGMLVRIVRDGYRQTKGLTRATGTPVIGVVPEARLHELMSQTARWKRFDKRSGGWVDALPPKWAVQVLAARGEWRFPPLDGIAETPFLRPDGSIADQPGYDEPTRVLVDVIVDEFPAIPDQPTIDDAREALGQLLEPIEDFPFVSTNDTVAAIATILTILARPAIDGPSPMFAVRATAPGTGKSLLVDVISTIGTGRAASRMSSPRDDEESRKRILAVGLESLPVVLIDNVEGLLGSQSLAAALTSTTWSDRLLGVSKTVTVPLRAVWLATGNQMRFKGDLGRRVVPIDLDAGVEHPEDRSGFRHENLLAWVREHRSDLVTAALTILRAYHVAGCPGHGKPPKGSFEDWDRVVRGALVWASGEDPLVGCERVRADADADLDALRGVLQAWHSVWGDQPQTAAKVIERAREDGDLEAALSSFARCNPSRLSASRLGYALRGGAGRIASGLTFQKAGATRTGVALWVVRAMGDSKCRG